MQIPFYSAPWKLSDFADVSQIVIAVANLGLAGYIFLYERRKHRESQTDAASSFRKSIEIDRFRELILLPNMLNINRYYEAIYSIEGMITSNEMTVEERTTINEFVKTQQRQLRKNFIELLDNIDKDFANKLLINLDGLTDGITEEIFNEEHKLKMPTVYEKYIGAKIDFSRSNFYAELYKYQGS